MGRRAGGVGVMGGMRLNSTHLPLQQPPRQPVQQAPGSAGGHGRDSTLGRPERVPHFAPRGSLYRCGYVMHFNLVIDGRSVDRCLFSFNFGCFS